MELFDQKCTFVYFLGRIAEFHPKVLFQRKSAPKHLRFDYVYEGRRQAGAKVHFWVENANS